MMRPKSWAWAEDCLSVEAGGLRYAIDREQLPRLPAALEEFDSARWLFEVLHEADAAARGGEIRYAGATDPARLPALRLEIASATSRFRASMKAFGLFFVPSGLLDTFASDSESLVAFMREAMERLRTIRPEDDEAVPLADPQSPEGT